MAENLVRESHCRRESIREESYSGISIWRKQQAGRTVYAETPPI